MMLFADAEATPWSNVVVMFITGVLIPLVGWIIRQQWRAEQKVDGVQKELELNTAKTETAAKSAAAAAVTSKAAAVNSDAAAETTASIHQIVNGERTAMQAKIESLTAENARLKATNVVPASPAPAG